MSGPVVLGAGAWGQALATVLAADGAPVTLVARRPEAVRDAAGLSRRLAIALPANVVVSAEAPAGGDGPVFVAVPVPHLRPALAGLGGTGPLVMCCKGMESAGGLLPGELAAAAHSARAVAVLSGPNFAGEIARGQPAASVLAAADAVLAATLARRLTGARLRVYVSGDPLGCGLAGASKNVIAIAAGVCVGRGLGENARAALVTRGLAEIARLLRAEGAQAETAFGLAGMGDLLLTCTGTRSRNFRVGLAIGRGERPDTGDEVAEGVATAPVLLARAAGRGVEMPIVATVAALLRGAIDADGAADALMGRPVRGEW